MIDIASTVEVLMVGLLLGAFFFGGLFWTIKRGLSSQRPTFWFLGSWLIRISVATLVFYFISEGRWERLLICLGGFLTARFVLNQFTRNAEKQMGTKQELGDAP
ncbi:MAG: hypothetical protein PF447_14395 [Spirochaetaceae bacterium]|jgi:F1F0 ATPase subunit 2|nr:hypothetical protein [Spirochaetaceae bacterium]